MAKLKKAEIQELRRLSLSSKLRSDFRALNNIRARLENKAPDTDLFIKFATVSNAFTNHKRKLFQKMIGNNFKL